MRAIAALLAAGLLQSGLLSAQQFGTGFAISPKGYLVTCHHVVGDSDRILVHSSEGTRLAKIIAIDPRNDLAILKVDQWNGSFLPLAPSRDVRYASEVTAVGFPDPKILGRNPKISKGIINALSGVRDDPRYLQTSTPIQPGNSGGPLISESGRVVGIIASRLNSIDRMSNGGYLPQSVNFAIKSNFVHPLLENASVSLPWISPKTRNPQRQIERALTAIALIEASPSRVPRIRHAHAPRQPSAPLPWPSSRPRTVQAAFLVPRH